MTVFINEFHYDNAGTDAGEFIELAVATGTDLTGWSLVLYNGSNGTVYDTIDLSGETPGNETNGVGFVSIGFPSNGIQNGSPDGIALVDGIGGVVQFLSYEGSFTAVGGAADGLTSTDIGVEETSSTPLGAALGLTGTGTAYADFSWAVIADDTPGSVNGAQSFTAPVAEDAWINEFHYDNAGSDTGEFIEIAGAAGTDLSGWSVALYNGSNGAVYDTVALSGVLGDDTGSGFGFSSFDRAGIQNGSPDGIALIDDLGAVVEFLSYEGSVTAVGGAADGMISTDIGVEETSSTPAGQSLQLTGSGTTGSDFTWAAPQAETKDAANTGQTLGTPVAIPGVTVAETGGGTDVVESGATDSFDIVLDAAPAADVTITLTPDAEIALDKTVLTFTPANWDSPQTVTATAVADAVDEDPDLHSGVVSFSVASTDGDYDGLAIPDLTATITDDQLTATKIHAIQGAGDASPLDGQVVTVQAVVVGDFQDGDADTGRDLSGFYLQEEDADADGDALTSEGIFVFDDAFGVDVSVGDIVTVTGTVDEFFGETQIDSVTSVTVESSGNALPDAAQIDLSVLNPGTTISQGGDIQPDLERFEGMLVEFTDTLTVTEMFQLDRFNEIKLFEGDRPQQFTQTNAPDQAGYQAYLEEVGGLTITYDDGLNLQNAAIDNLDGFAPFGTSTAVSMGDTIAGLSGVMDYKWAGNGASGATWRVRATEDGENAFTDTNPADTAMPELGGDLKIASFNVLNFFTTLDEGGNVTDTGAGPRGADSQAEYDRQIEKLVTALVELDADVVGLVEIENTNDSRAVKAVVDALNAELGAGTYGFVDTGLVGTDAITNAFIHKTATVSLNGAHAVLDTPEFVDPLGAATTGTSYNRPAIAQSFTETASGESFTAVVNHLKSKGSLTGAAADDDQGDGAGNNNATRDAAAAELASWLATDPTADGGARQIILGDLNAYAQEDPIQTLIAAGFDDLAQDLIGPDAYSFVFDGLTGTLDYAMTDSGWSSLVNGVVEWHVNSDEADALDYNLDFGRDPGYFDGASPLRNSDHDPVVVGINLVADVRLFEKAGGGLVLKDDYAVLSRALGDAADGDKIVVVDNRAIGDFGTLGVAADDLVFRAGRKAEGELTLGAGVADIRLGGGTDTDVTGNDADNRILGSFGENVIEGGAGRDRLLGRDGDDILSGGAARDVLRGDAGADIFRIVQGAEREVILDFDQSEGDSIALVGFGIAGFSEIEDLLTDRASGVVLDLGGGDILKIKGGVTAAELSSADFSFFDPGVGSGALQVDPLL